MGRLWLSSFPTFRLAQPPTPLHYIRHHFSASYFAVLHYISLHYIIFHCITLYFTALHDISLYCIICQCIALYFTALHYISLYNNISLQYINIYITYHIQLKYIIQYMALYKILPHYIIECCHLRQGEGSQGSEGTMAVVVWAPY